MSWTQRVQLAIVIAILIDVAVVLGEIRTSRLPGAGNRHRQAHKQPQQTLGRRDGRFLSLFTVVRFDQLDCMGQSGDNGTCMSASDCTSRGGIPSGPCASGFGTCCLFMASCGATTQQNGTYFVNKGYPKMFDSTGLCQLTVLKQHPDVCQFRIDFELFQLMGPETVNHVCNNDQFIISGGSPVPAICGVNSGNHMYVDAGLGATNPITLTFVTSGPTFPRQWKIRVTQIPCHTIYRAEDGCVQYHTGVSGRIKSYNYDPTSGLQLSNQDYSICVRVERNFCGIQYVACEDPSSVNNRSRSFSLSGNSNNPVQAIVGGGGFPGQQNQQCTNDWVGIPCARNVGRPTGPGFGPGGFGGQGGFTGQGAFGTSGLDCVDRICGGTFSAEVSLIPAIVMSSVKPFRVTYHTNNIEAPEDFGNRGFCLNYVQQPCTNVLT